MRGRYPALMYEIIILLIVLIGMAKRKPKRKFRKYLKGDINHRLVATGLAARTLVGTVLVETVNERTWLSSVKAAWSIESITAVEGAGPMMCGLAHSDYSDAEIEEFLENTGSWNEGDLVNQEIAKRKIRRVGVFDTPQAVEDAVVLNDGRPITTKCGWILLQGQTIRLWVYNMGQSAFATTDPELLVQGHANLWPR